ncbi:MAG: flagellar biosynthetic protein FliR [Thermoflexaceae bacterium]|nr:flagellar biosynthetic protein FliR [Thermoflexaceae bacterium]
MISYETFFSEWELFLLILMRIASFVYVAPFFNTANTPRKVKIGFAFFVSVIAMELYPDVTYEYTGVIGYAGLVMKEAIVGLLLGAICNFTMQIIHFAGRFIDMDIGLSMASVMDPTNNTQNGIVGSIYYYMVLLIMISSGLHKYLISAIVETFRHIPVGQMTVNMSLYSTVIDFMSQFLAIGFRISLPIFASMLLLNAVLAIMSKVAPHMNMFVVGMQLKIIGGLCVLLLIIHMLPAVSNYLYDLMKEMLYRVVQGMV